MILSAFRRRLALVICPELLAGVTAMVAPSVPQPAAEPDQISEAAVSQLIKALGAARGWKPTYAARMASGSGDALSRIAGGVGLTIRRANAIIQRCSDLWPDDQPWPSDIPRPAPNRKGVA